MGNIVVLDELTINKIAAGEVIERPASVIKEMVENSIDAGAKNINVEIKNGGISYIRIADDGKGIDKEDLELSFERHATSKIRSAEDLSEVKSMGFRGEALASIAAIAKVEMVSKTADADTGYKINVEGGNVKNIEEIGCPNGTTFTVEELFYNTPVRYKFLKKDYTETGYIEDVITRLALIHPEIAFKLVNSGKTIIQTTGDGDMKNVIYSIYGKTVASACLNVNYEFEGMRVTGIVGKPEIARSNRANQIFFVNKRYIRDRILSNSAEKAFKGMIPIGKFGFLVLNIECNPSEVDVNVHPAKLEVRFKEEQKVFKAVYCAIQDTLLKAELVANSETPITGKLGKENDTEEKDKEFEEDKEPAKSTLSGLFRKIAKNANENDVYDSSNVIESIFRSKNTEGTEEKKEESIQVKEEKDGDIAYKEMSKIDAIREKYGLGSYSNNAQKQEEKEKKINNEEQIKNTINEFLQMGENLTAEQIREKISKIAQANVNDNSKEIVNTEKLINENIVNEDVINENAENENAEKEDTPSIDTENTLLENEDKYSTKVINFNGLLEDKENEVDTSNESNGTSEIQNEENKIESEEDKIQIEDNTQNIEKVQNKPGDILLNILQAKSKREEEKQEPIAPIGKFDDMYEQIFGNATANAKAIEKEEQEKSNANDIVNSNMNIFEDSEEYKEQIPYKIIGIAFKTYIILEIEDELYILDQHAAHERIMYEKVKKNYYSNEEKDSQLMLLPDIITLTHKEMDIARENMDKFEKAGFVLEEFGDNTIKLTGVPNICLDLDTKELFLETLDEINTVARTAKQEIEERFIATIACKAAVKANMALTVEEVQKLLDELLKLPNPFTCPHGRPTAIKLSKTDIEKKFARRK